MPTVYAHYRFGAGILPTLPADARRTIQRFRSLYDAGLHGPDIFYYYPALLKTKNSFLGIKYHEQTGREFFQRVCRMVRLDKSEGAQAYLYGLLCHYALDKACHELIARQECQATHAEMETEFDRFLLEKDGKIPACNQDLSLHLRLTPGECEMVAKFYSPTKASVVRSCISNMAKTLKLLATPEGRLRSTMEKGLSKIAPELRGMVMSAQANENCAQTNEALYACYEKVFETFPELLSQLQAHMTYNGPLGQEFDQIFG